MVGQRFGRLVVISYLPSVDSKRVCLCKCDCGKTSRVWEYNLKNGNTQSCGCFRLQNVKTVNLVHGHTVSRKPSPTYYSWSAMLIRCRYKTHKQWKDYGGRGISVCRRWLSFSRFLADMGPRPRGKTLDRYPNPDGNYEPKNCRWATRKQQANNRSRVVHEQETVKVKIKKDKEKD